MKLLFLLGLTGVGKSTAVVALQDADSPFILLPNRRTLTDERIIPEMQWAAGKSLEPVTDRLGRFELTRRYRESYPGGMVHALSTYLVANPPKEGSALVFDNLRGLDEAKAATETFPDARFILLDAPPLVRVQRLVGRADVFDKVSGVGLERTSFTEQLSVIDGIDTIFDIQALALLAAQGVPRSDLLKAVHIILAESQNYDMAAAASYLRRVKDAHAFLQLDTAALSREDVQAQIRGWL